MINGALAQSTSSAMLLIQLLYGVVLLAVITGLMVYFKRYRGTGGRLDPLILWRKYGKTLIVLTIIAIGYANLDYYCSFDVSLDNANYNVGEVIELNCTVTNPLPVPVYYRGHGWINIDTSYLNGTKVQRTQLTISEAAAQAAAEEAQAASGEYINKGFIMPNGVKTIKTVRYTPMHEGEIIIYIEYSGFSKSRSLNLSHTIGEYSPVEVTVNSPGITLYLEKSTDSVNPTILIKLGNDNPYPVKIKPFSHIEIVNDSPDSELRREAMVDFFVPFWDIPAYSSRTIYNTEAYASDTRTPIYFTLYGKTVGYPPDS